MKFCVLGFFLKDVRLQVYNLVLKSNCVNLHFVQRSPWSAIAHFSEKILHWGLQDDGLMSFCPFCRIVNVLQVYLSDQSAGSMEIHGGCLQNLI